MNGSRPESLGFTPNENAPDKDDILLINITGEFDNNTIVNIENRFQRTYQELIGTEINFEDLILFFENINPNTFWINFRTQGKFEQIGEIRGRIIELIHEWGGKLID